MATPSFIRFYKKRKRGGHRNLRPSRGSPPRILISIRFCKKRKKGGQRNPPFHFLQKWMNEGARQSKTSWAFAIVIDSSLKVQTGVNTKCKLLWSCRHRRWCRRGPFSIVIVLKYNLNQHRFSFEDLKTMQEPKKLSLFTSEMVLSMPLEMPSFINHFVVSSSLTVKKDATHKM